MAHLSESLRPQIERIAQKHGIRSNLLWSNVKFSIQNIRRPLFSREIIDIARNQASLISGKDNDITDNIIERDHAIKTESHGRFGHNRNE